MGRLVKISDRKWQREIICHTKNCGRVIRRNYTCFCDNCIAEKKMTRKNRVSVRDRLINDGFNKLLYWKEYEGKGF